MEDGRWKSLKRSRMRRFNRFDTSSAISTDWRPCRAESRQASVTICVFNAHIGQASFSLPERIWFGEVADHVRVLRGRVARISSGSRCSRRVRRQLIRTVTIAVDFKSRFAARQMHKIRHAQIAFRAADDGPLLKLRRGTSNKNRPKRCRRKTVRRKNPTAPARDRRVGGLRKNFARDFARQFASSSPTA